MNEVKSTGCCPPFDPERWDGKVIGFGEKNFVRDRVRSVFHIPLNFGGVMKRNMEAIFAEDACDPDNVVLSDENSLWGADVYIATSKEMPGARNERVSGEFFAKVFEGHYSQAGKWCKELTKTLEAQGTAPKKTYFWYTTCPKCAKAYGKNYVVLLAER